MRGHLQLSAPYAIFSVDGAFKALRQWVFYRCRVEIYVVLDEFNFFYKSPWPNVDPEMFLSKFKLNYRLVGSMRGICHLVFPTSVVTSSGIWQGTYRVSSDHALCIFRVHKEIGEWCK